MQESQRVGLQDCFFYIKKKTRVTSVFLNVYTVSGWVNSSVCSSIQEKKKKELVQ